MASAKTCDTCCTRSSTSMPRIGSQLENLMAVLMLRQPPGSCAAQASSAAACRSAAMKSIPGRRVCKAENQLGKSSEKIGENRGHPIFHGLFRKVGVPNCSFYSAAMNSSAETSACLSSPDSVPILISECIGITQPRLPSFTTTWLPRCRTFSNPSRWNARSASVPETCGSLGMLRDGEHCDQRMAFYGKREFF